jgi:uncharacterized phage protein gp47/JayE
VSGLTPQGFDKPTLNDCLEETKTSIWTAVSDKVNLSSASPLGQVIGVLSERESKLWDGLEAVYDARKRDSASGSALRSVASLTGTTARSATPTVVSCTVNVDSGFSQAAGAMVAHVDGDPTKRFINQASVANATGITTSLPVSFIAETPGAVFVAAATLTVIAEPLAGWNSITNAVDGVTGFDDDTDATLRARSESELQAPGSTTADAIRADILNVLKDNITNCTVLANEGDIVDVNGLPPHSIEVVALGKATDLAASTALANQILASKDAADHAFGQATIVTQDAQGNDHAIGYTWVATVDVYFIVGVKINAKKFPVDGDAQIQKAIVAVQGAYNPGDGVIAERIKAACFSVAGVTDVPSLTLGTSPSPVGTANLTIGVRQIAAFDTTRIAVNHV